MGRKNNPASDKPAEDGVSASSGDETTTLAKVDEAPPESPSEETKDESKPEETKEDEGPKRLAPEAWAKRLGKVGKVPGVSFNKKDRPAPLSWDHAAADQIHGWSLHKQHSAEPLLLLQEDYEAALSKAGTPDKTGNYQPHRGALSPFKRGK